MIAFIPSCVSTQNTGNAESWIYRRVKDKGGQFATRDTSRVQTFAERMQLQPTTRIMTIYHRYGAMRLGLVLVPYLLLAV